MELPEQYYLEDVLGLLEEHPHATAFMCSQGAFLKTTDQGVQRISPNKPQELVPVHNDIYTIEEVQSELRGLNGVSDYSFNHNDRWRAILSYRRVSDTIALEVKLNPREPPTLEELGIGGDLDPVFWEGLLEEGGMVLVCGPHRCCKTTVNYALMMQAIERRFAIVAADPIPFDPTTPENSLLWQIEIGLSGGHMGDTPSFAEALEQAAIMNPSMVISGKLPEGNAANKAVEIALNGSVMLAEEFSIAHQDAIRRLLTKGMSATTGDLSGGFRTALFSVLKLLVQVHPTTKNGQRAIEAEFFYGKSLQNIIKEWSK
jgi:Tfp pilus assembly pilus retraction ATPase PilT